MQIQMEIVMCNAINHFLHSISFSFTSGNSNMQQTSFNVYSFEFSKITIAVISNKFYKFALLH